MITLSNSLSFLRAPLAFLFLQENSALRVVAILLAMITDSMDGYLARRYSSTSRFGAILDPAMDKFFVYFVLSILYLENKIHLWEAFAMISRDLFLCVFAIYLCLMKKWKTFEIRPVRWGKATTALQFCILIGICLHYPFPSSVYLLLGLFGLLAFVELFQLALPHSTSS